MYDLYKIMNLMERIDPQYHRYASILNEDKRGKAAKKACYSILRQHYNNADWLDKEYNVPNNTHHLSTIDWMYDQFIDKFYHENSYQNGAIMRLAPLFLRLALEAGFGQGNEDIRKLNRLRAIEDYLHQANKTQGMDLKNISLDMSYAELNNAFGKAVDNEEALKKERIENGEYEDDNDYNGYEIVGPLTYEEAHEYGNHSCPGGKLCYTQGRGTWGNYTSNGMNDVYVLLKDGWESIPAEHDDDGMDGYNGYDRYGLSMIFVFVNGDGRLAYCNTRWNHNANYKPGRSVDHALNEEDISKLIGKNFYKVFKPNYRWQKKLNDILNRLKDGEDMTSVFDYVSKTIYDTTIVGLNHKYNVINNNYEFISDRWYDWINSFNDGVASVKYDDRYNYINTEGELISPDEWFDEAFDFREGFGAVTLNHKLNFIDKQGRLLSKQWFEDSHDFSEGFAAVKLNGKFNHIGKDGRFLSKQWFSGTRSFKHGIAKVALDRKYNFITTEGKLLSKVWFDATTEFEEDGYAKVKLDKQYNLIDKQGKLISPMWFDDVDLYSRNGFFKVASDNKENLISVNGKLFLKHWFDWVGYPKEGFAPVYSNNEDGYNFVDANGELISKHWFKSVDNFNNGFGRVKDYNNKWNFIDGNGNFLSNEWYDYVDSFSSEGISAVRNGEDFNFLNREGKLLSPNLWFDNIGLFYYGFAKVNTQGRWNYIDVNGNLLSNKWFDNAYQFNSNGVAKVTLNGNLYEINKRGELKLLYKNKYER